MDQRTLAILEAESKEIIETDTPVSSGQIYRKRRFNVKRATIRNELHALSEGAFLEQPHTSGGRIPTDKAYRFFVERIFEDSGAMEEQAVHEISDMREALESGAVRSFVTTVSDALNAVSVGYLRPGSVVKSGLDDLIDELIEYRELSDIREVAAIIHDIEMIDERMEDMLNFVEGDRPQVFIGKSPITKSPHLSVIADRLEVQGKPFVLAAVGSKRMDYENNIHFFIRLKNNI